MFKDRVYVPSSAIREQILSQYHDNLLAGHSAQMKMLDLIEHNFYWPDVKKDVTDYVTGSETYQ